MPHARIRIAALLAVALLALGACSSTEAPTPVISNPPAPPAPAALPADWSESVLDVPGADGAATYVAPRNPSRLRAALILGSADKAGEVATRELSVMLAQLGVASLRFDGGPSGADHTTLLGRAGRGLAALAERSGLGDDRLLAIGHGTAAPLALALGAGGTGRQPMPIGLIEPFSPASRPGPLTPCKRRWRCRGSSTICSPARTPISPSTAAPRRASPTS
ncbi:hypothetical protein [Tsukamurella sp. PLM1]|uniref:hypothetical protein n=1 Tax=Tsukamurella sp. PLM1 TaxID=2929795 RepID=UPI0020662918|nr:hypothetical protein [Tsukamurella sp. PLM1]BDH57558.1 hypothetical protein MTP03_24970 [Tsukamurella sp. PLM1]